MRIFGSRCAHPERGPTTPGMASRQAICMDGPSQSLAAVKNMSAKLASASGPPLVVDSPESDAQTCAAGGGETQATALLNANASQRQVAASGSVLALKDASVDVTDGGP
jgi:hypothetical protein